MVEERLRDGRRLAELLASEVTGHGDDLEALSVTDADPDVEPAEEGAFAYAITREGDPGSDGSVEAETGERVAAVFVHPERIRVAFEAGGAAVAEKARDAGLEVRRETDASSDPVVFVEDGAQVKRILPSLRAVAAEE
ncbi:MAG: hypothetical protein ABEK02_03165 [Haloquadratum sp.]